jgi:hypothetical protein
MIISGKHQRRKKMDKRVDKGEEFVREGMTLITEVDSERHLRRAKKLKDVKEGEIFDNQEEWADGFCGK